MVIHLGKRKYLGGDVDVFGAVGHRKMKSFKIF
jgi:hypothetical protein